MLPRPHALWWPIWDITHIRLLTLNRAHISPEASPLNRGHPLTIGLLSASISVVPSNYPTVTPAIRPSGAWVRILKLSDILMHCIYFTKSNKTNWNSNIWCDILWKPINHTIVMIGIKLQCPTTSLTEIWNDNQMCVGSKLSDVALHKFHQTWKEKPPSQLTHSYHGWPI